MKTWIAFVSAMLAFGAMADEWYDETTGFTWRYTISGDEACLTGVSPTEGELPPLPSMLGGKPVTSIFGNSFNGCRGLTGSLIIPNSVTSIGERAFYGCTGFTDALIIGDNVTNIGDWAFASCTGFTGSLIIPDNVTTIGRAAFEAGFGFTGSLIIGNSVTSIGMSAFNGCRFTGSLVIPDGVTIIKDSAFANCSGFTGSLVIPDSVTIIEAGAFGRCSGFSGQCCTFLGSPPKGVENSFLFSYFSIVFPEQYGAKWQKLLDVANRRERLRPGLPEVSVLSSQMREGDPTVMDVVYKVTSTNPTVKVRALAFQDGERSFAKVVRPETFVDGTSANLGDGVTANEEHTLSWKVSADWQTTLAKVKFEVLAVEDEVLPLELVTLPADGTHPAMQVSWNYVVPNRLFDALLWLYADHDLGLTLVDGVLKNGDTRLASGGSVSGADTMYEASRYVYGKMGYDLLQGETLEYVKERTRLDLPDISQRQYAVKILGE